MVGNANIHGIEDFSITHYFQPTGVTRFMATIPFPHVGLACKGCASGFRISFRQQQLSSEQVLALVDRQDQTYSENGFFRAFRATPVGRTSVGALYEFEMLPVNKEMAIYQARNPGSDGKRLETGS